MADEPVACEVDHPIEVAHSGQREEAMKEEPLTASPPVIQDFEQEKISEQQIRALLLNQVKRKITYSRKPVNKMIINDILTYNGYFYQLKTLVEERVESERQRIYHRKEIIDGCNFGSVHIWDIRVEPPSTFVECIRGAVRVPHTDEIRSCKECAGSGQVSTSETTINSDASTSSHSSPQICSTCRGAGCSIWNREFKSKFKVESQELLTVKPEVIGCNIFEAGVVELLNRTSERATPLEDGQFVDQTVLEFARRAVAKDFVSKAIRRQQEVICAIPIVQVTYTLEGKSGTFHLYGTNRKVHFPNYPNRKCSIM